MCWEKLFNSGQRQTKRWVKKTLLIGGLMNSLRRYQHFFWMWAICHSLKSIGRLHRSISSFTYPYPFIAAILSVAEEFLPVSIFITFSLTRFLSCALETLYHSLYIGKWWPSCCIDIMYTYTATQHKKKTKKHRLHYTEKHWCSINEHWSIKWQLRNNWLA